MAVFKPTGTTDLLIKSVKPFIKSGRLLDLGCGCGVVGATFRDKCQVYASDLSEDAIRAVKNDYPDIDARQGSIFEPWSRWVEKHHQGLMWEFDKFDYIIDDISGVSEDLSFPWFNGVPCDSGKDGANLICEVLIEARNHLYSNGILFFPIVSLSNADRILKLANYLYKVEHIGHQDFPLPTELQNKTIPKEYIKEKFGMKLFWTDIYKANPNNKGE